MAMQNPKPVRAREASPPTLANYGDAYLVIGTATGAWATKETNVAQWNGASWDFTVPVQGDSVFVEAEGRDLFFIGTGWVPRIDAMSRIMGVNFERSGTNIATGTTGAQTINKPCGSVNFAAAATSLVVTNSLITSSTLVLAWLQTLDATAVLGAVVPGAGSFTINMKTAPTAETRVAWLVVNVLP